MPTTLGILLRTTLILLAALVCLSPAAVWAQHANPPTPPRHRLYLWAGGAQNAVAERYLRALCDAVKRDTQLLERYHTISVYRYAPDLPSAARAMYNSNLAESRRGTLDLEMLQMVMEQQEFLCWQRPGADGTPSGLVELISLEVLSPPLAGQLRSQYVAIDGNDHRARPPQYIPSSEDPLTVAQRLGALYLNIPREQVLSASIVMARLSNGQCRNREDLNCGLLGETMTLTVRLDDSVWLPSDGATISWTAACNTQPVDGTTYVFDPIWVSDRHSSTVDVRINHVGTCSFFARLEALGYSYEARSEPYRTEAGPLLFWTTTFDRRSAYAFTVLREIPILPGILSASNAARASNFMFRQLRVLDERRALTLGRRLRDAIFSMLDIGEPQLDVNLMTMSATGVLDELGDTLAHEVITESRYEAVGASRAHPLCTEIWRRGPGSNEDQERDRLAWLVIQERWTERCSATVRVLRDRALEDTAAPGRLMLSRIGGQPGETFDAVPVLAHGAQSVVELERMRLQLPTGSATRTGLFRIRALGDANSLSPGVVGRVDIVRHRPQAGLLFNLGATSRADLGRWTGGTWLSFYYMMLDEVLRLEVDIGLAADFSASMPSAPPADVMVPARRAEIGLELDAKIAGSISLIRSAEYFFAAATWRSSLLDHGMAASDDFVRSFSAHLGIGYNMPLDVAFTRIDLGWRPRPYSTFGFALSARMEIPWRPSVIGGPTLSLGAGFTFL